MENQISTENNAEVVPQQAKTNRYAVPLAIVGAGFLIGAAIFGSSLLSAKNRPSSLGSVSGTEQSGGPLTDGGEENLTSVTDEDHIRGNPDAPVKIVEYSDMECPFCKRFHSTMQQAIDEYGKDGQVAWVYRHFPLDSIHSKARPEAVASECANELGGNETFWKFTDRFFELTPSNNQTDIETVIPQIAREIGLKESQFASCLTSGKYDEHIQDDLDNAIATGGNGTPWSIVVAANGKKYPLSGAQPYTAVKQLIELALQEK